MSRTRRQALAATLAVVALVPLLGGCFNGFNAQTTLQSRMNTGNGTQAQIGDVRVENATLVRGPEGSRTATLVVTFVGSGYGDTIQAIEIGGKPAFITGQTIPVSPMTSVSFGWNSTLWINSYDFEAAASSYVPVRFTLERSGIRDVSVLTVAPEGMYAGIAPTPPTAPLT